MERELAILWFRHDLRLHDNEALFAASSAADYVLPVYIIDLRYVNGLIPGGILKMSRTRLLFLLESIRDLRKNLRDRGSDLVVRVGDPERIIFELADQYHSYGVYCNRERMPHEVKVQDTLEKRLWTLGQEMHYYRGKMLFYTSDLPFPVSRTPDKFSSFLKETQHFISVRSPIESQESVTPFPDIDIASGPIPTLSEFGLSTDFSNPEFTGGETNGGLRLIQSIDRISQGKTQHLRISPWLSTGSLSPKLIYHKLNTVNQASELTVRSLHRKLILRDYYRLTGKKETDALFSESGFRGKSDALGCWDESLWQNWITGNTGHDYVDACMKCLHATGYLSHVQRKAVAHFLIFELNVHWLLGAGYFESALLDYDPCSNYGNWQRAAGLSLDQKGVYKTNFDVISEQLDPDGKFRARWKTDSDFQSQSSDFRIENSELRAQN